MQVHDVMLLWMEELDSFRVVLLMESESSLEVCFKLPHARSRRGQPKKVNEAYNYAYRL